MGGCEKEGDGRSKEGEEVRLANAEGRRVQW